MCVCVCGGAQHSASKCSLPTGIAFQPQIESWSLERPGPTTGAIEGGISREERKKTSRLKPYSLFLKGKIGNKMGAFGKVNKHMFSINPPIFSFFLFTKKAETHWRKRLEGLDHRPVYELETAVSTLLYEAFRSLQVSWIVRSLLVFAKMCCM